MTQGVVSSSMPTLPVVHLAHVVETGAGFAIGGVVVGAVLMVLIRRSGWSWTCGLPVVTVAPFAWLLGWRAGMSARLLETRSERGEQAGGAVLRCTIVGSLVASGDTAALLAGVVAARADLG